MKISWKWLQEFVPLKNVKAEAVGEKLTIHTAELEEIIPTDSGDDIFDIDNKSLTHRPDLMGHRGFARELSAIFEANLILPEPLVTVPTDLSTLPVRIETDNCKRFCGIQINNITVAPAPKAAQTRLEDLEVRAISNLVDITNHIMLEYGQPMHVFDADKIEGAIVVRQAKPGEMITTLDDQTFKLSSEDMVIADEVKVLSIAGVMGGLESSVTAQTKNIIFEAANFNPTAIRKTSQRLGLRSESSMRFEKSLDPYQCKRALFAACEKALEYCPDGQIATQAADVFPQIPQVIKIKLDSHQVRSLSGLDIDDSTIVKILERLDFTVQSESSHEYEVTVPSNRSTKDIAIPEDLIEEIVRLYGLENVPTKLPALPVTPPRKNLMRDLDWVIRDLSSHLGYKEVYNYSFVDQTDGKFTGLTDYIEIENPLSGSHTHMRQTLVSNGIKDVESELRKHQSVKLFEIGKIYRPSQTKPADEFERACLIQADTKLSETDVFYQLKSDLETWFKHLNIEINFQKTSTEVLKKLHYIHPVKSAEIWHNDLKLGIISSLHPLQKPFKKGTLCFAEIELKPVLQTSTQKEIIYQAPSNFPSVRRDISLVSDEKVFIGDLVSSAHKASPLLQTMTCFDEFRDPEKLGANFKNLAFHLEFQAQDKTLGEADIDAAVGEVLKILKDEHQAVLRLEFDQKS